MSLATDAAGFSFWTLDLVRQEVWVSERWRELYGLAPGEAVDFYSTLQHIHPDDRDVLRQTYEMVLADTSDHRYRAEFRLLPPDGAIRWIASAGRVETDAAGHAVLRGASLDISARKQAEQVLQALQQEIAHAGRVSLMGQLASALAYEINQPLGSILYNAEAAELCLQEASPDVDELRAILADIRRDTTRASTVIDRMRALLQRHTLDARRLDVGALVSDVSALVRADAASRHVGLDVDVPSGLPPITGDRVHLQQVLLNLILNSMDALDEIPVATRRIGVTARVDTAQMLEVMVDDAGPGIPAETLPQIFKPFFTTKPHGLGLGLAISRSIVDAHGGRLWAENRRGGGAAFRFTLPIADGATSARSTDKAARIS
jgi:PAS domain S-box-containing protein